MNTIHTPSPPVGFDAAVDALVRDWNLHAPDARRMVALVAPHLLVVGPLTGKYADVLAPFVAMMEKELHANAGKGDRAGWVQMDRKTALLEIFYHLSKLQKAAKDDDQNGIREYAADVANMSMMLADVCGVIEPNTALTAANVVPRSVVDSAYVSREELERARQDWRSAYDAWMAVSAALPESDAGPNQTDTDRARRVVQRATTAEAHIAELEAISARSINPAVWVNLYSDGTYDSHDNYWNAVNFEKNKDFAQGGRAAAVYGPYVKSVPAQEAERIATLEAEARGLRADAERLDWLEANCVNVADEYGTASQLYFGTYATRELRTAIDSARSDAAREGA